MPTWSRRCAGVCGGLCGTLVLTAVLGVTGGCGPSAPSSRSGDSGAQTVAVRGTERIGWDQPGDVTGLTFRAYVDGRRVDLVSVVCGRRGREGTACAAPLPLLAGGRHHVTLTAVSADGAESAPSQPIVLLKE